MKITIRKRDGIFKLKDIAFVLLCFFIFDGVFHITRKIPFVTNVRELLFFILILMCIPFLVKNKKWLANKYTWLVIAIMAVVSFSVFRGILGHGEMEHVVGVIKEFIYLFYFPIMLFCVDSEERLDRLLRWISILGSILSYMSIFVVVANLFVPSICERFVSFSSSFEFLNVYNPIGITVRVMYTGVVTQVIAVFCCIYFYTKNKMNNKKFLFLSVVNTAGIFLTYSRGLILGVACGALLYFLFHVKMDRVEKKKFWTFVCIFFGSIAVIVTAIVLSRWRYVIGFFFERLQGSSTYNGESDDLRQIMVKMLNKLISEHPFFGGGAASHINLRDGFVEMTYHDLLTKIGIVGLLIFLFPITWMIIDLSLKKNKANNGVKICLISALMAVMVSTYTNPYLLGSLGLLLYVLCMISFSLKVPKQRVTEDCEIGMNIYQHV